MGSSKFYLKSKESLILKKESIASVYYHSLFDYPLTYDELSKWKLSNSSNYFNKTPAIIEFKNGFYFVKGKKATIKLRTRNEKASIKKLKVASIASMLITLVPGVLMVGVTGSLAMRNAGYDSDIDLMVITKKDILWTTRLLVYLLLKIGKYQIRVPGKKDEKNKLCLNIWLDESALSWKKKNLYTAHEIAQVIPLINKENTYQKFIHKNKWILSYWPNAIRLPVKNISFQNTNIPSKAFSLICAFMEPFFYVIQKMYMKPKITREKVSQNRAVFHPRDLSEEVLQKFKKWA